VTERLIELKLDGGFRPAIIKEIIND